MCISYQQAGILGWYLLCSHWVVYDMHACCFPSRWFVFFQCAHLHALPAGVTQSFLPSRAFITSPCVMAFCTSINKGHIPIHIPFLCTVISADAVTNTAASGWQFRAHYDDDNDDDDEYPTVCTLRAAAVPWSVKTGCDYEYAPVFLHARLLSMLN